MSVSRERRQLILGALVRAMRRRSVRWSLGAFLFVNTLLLLVLLLTEQLHWLPALWPRRVTRTLFQIFFVTSVVDTVLFGTASLGAALSQRRKTEAQADPMKRLRRAFIVPVTYLLSALWGWAWLMGHHPKLFGGAILSVFVIHQIVLTVYFATRTFRLARAADTGEDKAAEQTKPDRELDDEGVWPLPPHRPA